MQRQIVKRAQLFVLIEQGSIIFHTWLLFIFVTVNGRIGLDLWTETKAAVFPYLSVLGRYHGGIIRPHNVAEIDQYFY